jgi:hypothetical protein
MYKLVNTDRKDMYIMMDKVLYGYPTKGYVIRAVAEDNEFWMSYHKEYLPSHVKFSFDSIEELLTAMEEIAAFSDWRDVLYDEDDET